MNTANTIKAKTRIQSATDDFVDAMKRHYGTRLVRIVLFGSYARGDFHEDSDLDLLVVLADTQVNHVVEIRQTVKQTALLALEHNIVISPIFASLQKATSDRSALFRFIRKEGVTIYE
jgi:predicted nucleotidyltransferase